MNQTSPSIAHQRRSVPAKKNAQIQAMLERRTPQAFAELPRRADRNGRQARAASAV